MIYLHACVYMLQCEVCFIRRTSAASNAIRTIDNEVNHLIHPLFAFGATEMRRIKQARG